MNNLNVAKIQLNGTPYEINNGINLNELLNKLKIQKNKVAIEVNGAIVEKNKYPNFILNKDPFTKAKILIAGKNFGCGSSREHAPWSILDFGIKVIIAPSFADIFFNNCFKNGILPIKLSEDKINLLVDDSMKGVEFEVNLINQLIIINEKEFSFEVDVINKNCLVKGLDDIGSTLERATYIDEYEKKVLDNFAWRNPGRD